MLSKNAETLELRSLWLQGINHPLLLLSPTKLTLLQNLSLNTLLLLSKATLLKRLGKELMPSSFMEIYSLRNMQLKIMLMIEIPKKEGSSLSG